MQKREKGRTPDKRPGYVVKMSEFEPLTKRKNGNEEDNDEEVKEKG